CCENTLDGRDAHPTKQSKSSRNYATPALHNNLRMILVGCPACCENTLDGRDAHPTKQSKSSRNYATPVYQCLHFFFEISVNLPLLEY
ncbi:MULTISPECIES: hypothetical protein, partial [unclassified Microcoleus]|uniref:hypothetical protein n=1 Tax=unclassified Microcoleus TaxID=2642155 RepID=UPI002FD5EE13